MADLAMPARRRRYHMNDRAVQDEIIRYLADARARTQSRCAAPLSAGEAPKEARFAHFLARRYYRDRLARSFRYSRRFQKQTGRIAEEIVDKDDFNHFLRECVMGSLESSRLVGELALAHLMTAQPPGPWWAAQLEYEYCYFLQAGTSERASHADRPTPSVSAVCRRLEWALPEMLSRLRRGEAIGGGLHHQVALIFSRTAEGRIYVVEAGAALESVFLMTDGVRSAGEIAEASALSVEQARQALENLKAIGAVQGLG